MKMVGDLLQTRVAPFLDQLRSEGGLQLLRELMPIDHTVTALIDIVQQHVNFLTRKPKVQSSKSVLELKVRDRPRSYQLRQIVTIGIEVVEHFMEAHFAGLDEPTQLENDMLAHLVRTDSLGTSRVGSLVSTFTRLEDDREPVEIDR
jgi:hypothetical protein